MIKIDNPWNAYVWVALDTETTGQYPVGSEFCEIAAVKYYRGEIIDQFQTFVAPTRPMSQEVIAIHRITNEMVVGAPRIEDVIAAFWKFIDGCIIVAHHSPFDMGFLALEFEKSGLVLPTTPGVCSSLLSRRLIQESKNHRLQTLVDLLGIKKGQAHRAFDDSMACLEVLLNCVRRIPEDASLADLIRLQGVSLNWQDFSMAPLWADPLYAQILVAIEERQPVEVAYAGGSKPGESRFIYPEGVVRSPQGDYVVARDNPIFGEKKRFYLDRLVAPE